MKFPSKKKIRMWLGIKDPLDNVPMEYSIMYAHRDKIQFDDVHVVVMGHDLADAKKIAAEFMTQRHEDWQLWYFEYATWVGPFSAS